MALDKPRRRTYVTGQTLDAMETTYKPFSVAPNADDTELGAVRAFTVNIRNRSSTSSIYIKEGDDGDDVEIAPHENYPIYEPEGLQRITMKGDTGGETVEVRAIVGHNDFSIQDKIDGFLRAFSQYVGTATRDTRITAQDVNLDVESPSNLDFDVTGSVDANVTNSSLEVASDTSTFNVDSIASDVNINDTNNLNMDLQAQSVGDISVRDIEGVPVREFLSGGPNTLSSDDRTRWDVLTDSAHDGFITDIEFRVTYDASHTTSTDDRYDELEVQVGIASDGTTPGRADGIIPRGLRSARNIRAFARDSAEGQIIRYDEGAGGSGEEAECVIRIEPRVPWKFQSGDNVSVWVWNSTIWSSTSKTYSIAEIQFSYIERRAQ